MVERTCFLCGKTFETPHPTKAYCSDTCRIESHRKLNRDRYRYLKEHPEEKGPPRKPPKAEPNKKPRFSPTEEYGRLVRERQIDPTKLSYGMWQAQRRMKGVSGNQ